ncbi:hypothetical protein R1sor_009005 [Riccia sorocarpa]|uniref:protein-serine/threonine phosphatase n=1 Tax=Riccia sorocarpa TaxID=122646 RepID=A0ABD3H6J7_9MARC
MAKDPWIFSITCHNGESLVAMNTQQLTKLLTPIRKIGKFKLAYSELVGIEEVAPARSEDLAPIRSATIPSGSTSFATTGASTDAVMTEPVPNRTWIIAARHKAKADLEQGENGRRSSERERVPISSSLQAAPKMNPVHVADTGKGQGQGTHNQIVHGFSLVKGKSRHPMEDKHVAEFKRVKDHELGLFAIYDGHLGDSVPAYLQQYLFDNILKESTFWQNPAEAMKKAYLNTDSTILDKATTLGLGGSTAVTAILLDGKKLVVANVGDSRAVLCRGGVAIQLSVDHEPSAERGSIEGKGGFVSNMPGDVPRVDGQLAVARAFGDKSLKVHLSAQPDIADIKIDQDTEFLILASDGLWKVMKNQEATDLVRRVRDPQVAAKMLTDEALVRKSKDDISCIVVRFQ